MAGWTRNGKQSNKVDHSLVRCVVANNFSPCIIYSPELKELLPTPYILPNSTEFAELLKKKYVEKKEFIMKYRSVNILVSKLIITQQLINIVIVMCQCLL